MIIPKYVKIIMDKITEFGGEVFVVGGAVRDHLLHKPIGDYDLATSLKPEEVSELFKGTTLEHGKVYGTVTVVKSFHLVEITSFRKESGYTDLRHPEEIVFVEDLNEDLKRRDFTINAIAYNKSYTDPFNGISDLKNKIIRAVGDPETRIKEDALRILRALRFSLSLGFKIDEALRAAIIKHKDSLLSISKERITEEVIKMCRYNIKSLIGDYKEVFEVLFKNSEPYDPRDFFTTSDLDLNLLSFFKKPGVDFKSLVLPKEKQKLLADTLKHLNVKTVEEFAYVKATSTSECFELLKKYLKLTKALTFSFKNTRYQLPITGCDLKRLGLVKEEIKEALIKVKVDFYLGRFPRFRKKALKELPKYLGKTI